MTDITPERLAKFEAHLKGWLPCIQCGLRHEKNSDHTSPALTLEPADLWEWMKLLSNTQDSMLYSDDKGWSYENDTVVIFDRNSPEEATRAAVIAAMEKWEQERE